MKTRKNSRARKSVSSRESDKKIVIKIQEFELSDKSKICSKLKHVLCVDTDDILKQAMKTLEIKDSEQPTKETMDLINDEQKKIVENYIKNNDVIVFVGNAIDILIRNPTYNFFIKIDDLETAYKNYVLEHVKEIVSNHTKIKKQIKSASPIEYAFFPCSYDEFLKDYNFILKFTKRLKYLPKTEEEIITIINNLKN